MVAQCKSKGSYIIRLLVPKKSEKKVGKFFGQKGFSQLNIN